jgi:alpha-glucosidase
MARRSAESRGIESPTDGRRRDTAPQPRYEMLESGELQLRLPSAIARISVSEDGSVRIRAGAAGELPPDLDAALGRAPWTAAPAQLREREEGGLLLLHSGRLGGVRVEIDDRPFALRIRDRSGAPVAELSDFDFGADGSARASLASEPDEHLFGFGEKPGGLDKRGNQLLMHNRDADLKLQRDARYLSIPFFLAHAPERRGQKARGVLLDCAAPSRFDAAARTPDRVHMETSANGLDLCIFPGPLPADVLGRFTARVGRTPLPPRWALGHHQSRWGYRSEREVRALVRKIRARGLPTDAVHLDIDYMDGCRVFTWDPKRFPDPGELARELRGEGIRVVVIIDPGVKVDPDYRVYREALERGFFCERGDGSPYRLRVWPGDSALPDFNRPEVRGWWGEQHRPLLEAGVAGIWNDMNEPAGWQRDLRMGRVILPFGRQNTEGVVQRDPSCPEDPERRVPHSRVRNIYGLQECRATREFLEAEEPDRRHFLLSRSGYAGIQRFAAIWTGDNRSRWSHLRESLPMLMNLSISGVPFCGADIGGFFGNCTPELYARWIQIGSLYPFARTHSMWLGRRQEPWSFGPRVETIARAALELRMRLLPYLYGLFHQCEASGAPIWRPLFYEFPDDQEAAQVEDQVMIGPSLMAAPVLERGGREREIYLPEGVWWDWESDARYRGPRRLRVEAPLEKLPLFARGGSILPTQSPVQHAEQTPLEPVVLEAFPGAEGWWTLLEDDGETTAYRGDGGDPAGEDPGVLACTSLRLRDRAGGRLRIEIGRREGRFEIAERTLKVVIHGVPEPDAVFADGERLAEGQALPGYCRQRGRLAVRLPDRGEARSIEVEPAP